MPEQRDPVAENPVEANTESVPIPDKETDTHVDQETMPNQQNIDSEPKLPPKEPTQEGNNGAAPVDDATDNKHKSGQKQATDTGAGPSDATSGSGMGPVQMQGHGIDVGAAAIDKMVDTSGHGTASQNTTTEEFRAADKSNCCCKKKMGIWFAIAGSFSGIIGIVFPMLEWWMRGSDTSWLTLIFVMIYLGVAFSLFYLAKATVHTDRRQRESLMLEKAIEAAEKTDDAEIKKLVYRQIAFSIMGIED